MATDPFANAGTDSTTTTTTTPTETTTVATPNTESKIVVTLKGGAGFNDPWIVVHAADAQDALATLSDESMKELVELTTKVGKKFSESGAPARSAAPAGGKPAGATQAPNGQEPPEGYVFKSGMGKNGKPWKAFMPIDRNSGLDPIWL